MNAAASAAQVLKLNFKQDKSVENLEAPEAQRLLGNIRTLPMLRINLSGTIIRLLDGECTNLCNITFNDTTIPSNIQLSLHACNLIERLTSMEFSYVKFKNFSNFLPATYTKLKSLDLLSCSYKGKKPFNNFPPLHMKNLTSLRLRFIDDFGDVEFRQFTQNNLSKLTDLYLMELKMVGQNFDQLDLANLKQLQIINCEFNDDWLSKLSSNLRLLEVLEIDNIQIKGTHSREAFKYFHKLYRLRMRSLDLNNRVVSSMSCYMPNLRYWELEPNEDGLITDDAFRGLILHAHLEVIKFDRVQLTDTTLRKLILLSPNLKELSLATCICQDDSAKLVGKLQSLLVLSLQGTRMTDVGLAELEPILGGLSEFQFQSRLVTADSFRRIIPLLTAARRVGIYGGEPEFELQYYASDRQSYFGSLTLKGMTSDLKLLSLERFNSVAHLELNNVQLSKLEVESMSLNLLVVETFSVIQCQFTEEVAVILGKSLKSVITLITEQTRLSEATVIQLLEAVTAERSHNNNESTLELIVENEPFLSVESVNRLMMNIFPRCTFLRLCSIDNSKIIKTNNTKDNKTISIDGGQELSDDAVMAMAARIDKLSSLNLHDVVITSTGLQRFAQFTLSLTNLTKKSRTVDDEAMRIIGHQFQCCLTFASFECELVTDDGLEALGKHLPTLTTLTVKGTKITDDCVRRVAPKLTSINYLDIYDNERVTIELRDYMVVTYPKVQHEEFRVYEQVNFD